MIFKNKYVQLTLISGFIIVVDQITKAMILGSIAVFERKVIIPGFLNVTHVHNPGGAFGFLSNQSESLRTILFLFVSIIAVFFILYFYKNTPKTHPMLAAGFALIFGGAVGNLIDRVRFGKVIDFLDFYIDSLHWPAFNVADSAISIGMAIFIFHLVFNKMPPDKA